MWKKTLIALAAAAASGLGAVATAAPVTFNTNTSAGTITFNNMVWQAGNALVMGALSTPPTIDTDGDGNADAQLLRTVAQARLAAFTLTGSGASLSLPAGFEITYQADFWEIAQGIGGTTAGFTLGTPPPGFSNTVKFFFDSNALTQGDNTTGNNYGSEGGATMILEGTLSSLVGNFTDFTRLLPLNFPIKPLDCDRAGSGCVGFDGIDQAPGTDTHEGNGNNQILIDVTYQDDNFFKSDISSLLIDLAQTVGVGIPFNNGNPWTNVVDQTPYFSLSGGGRVNGADCTVGGQSQGGVASAGCDLLLQTTGLSTFNTTVPEPGSLALVGLALAGMGFGALRRQRRTA